jgi:molecular chaperone GrpE (heat shock protein)
MEMLNELITINKNEKTVNRTNHADTERILQEILSNVKNNSHQNKLMGTLHDEIQKLKGDFYKEIQLPVIMDFIEVIDDIKRILKRFENISEEKQSNYIIKELNECANMADGLLRNRRIYAYPVSTNTGQPFNSERQKIETCGIIATHDEALDELVAESVKHGYEWQTDDSKSRIIRKEVVRIYEFQECEEENNYRRINKTKIN